MLNLYDPTDPLNGYLNPFSDNATKEDMDEYERLHSKAGIGYIISFLITIGVLALITLFTSCSTSSTTTDTTDHRLTETTVHTDTVWRERTIIKQDSSWKQEILRQFQSIHESSDTSRYVIADTAGRVMREKIVIRNTRESALASDRQQLTILTSRLEQMDSILRSMQENLQRSDALTHDRQQFITENVKSPLSWWENIQLWFGRIAMIALAVIAAVLFIRKRLLPFIRKAIK